jgi:CRISPR/Cas system endoribonuclease Cas6 (RAMP superfamily)
MTNNTIARRNGLADNIPNKRNIFQSGITLSHFKHLINQTTSPIYNTDNPNNALIKDREGA